MYTALDENDIEEDSITSFVKSLCCTVWKDEIEICSFAANGFMMNTWFSLISTGRYGLTGLTLFKGLVVTVDHLSDIEFRIQTCISQGNYECA